MDVILDNTYILSFLLIRISSNMITMGTNLQSESLPENITQKNNHEL